MNTAEQTANVFHKALKAKDWLGLRKVLTDDASWLLPGENAISEPAENAEAVIKRAKLIAKYGMRFNLKKILISQENVSLYQHNKAESAGIKLDQFVNTLCRLRNGQIWQIETFVSDLEGFNHFFAELPNNS